jgi:ABC-type bacteriocin/lantibiotic exporter with double-glycine peptidase domain
MNSIIDRTRQRYLVPEVVQTSSMDCGPATLKALLEGFHIPVSYGRLREACQTDVDGTSIDALEVVAGQLGMAVEQVMIPVDHLFLTEAAALPAIVVVRHADGALHFVVVWRRHGAWLQVMDPAVGRRWVSCRQFAEQVFQHQLSVSATEWREWAESEDFLQPMRRRLLTLGADETAAAALIAQALAYQGWFALAALDASARLVTSVVQAGGIQRGSAAAKLLQALFDQTCDNPHDIFKIIPPAYWSAAPDTSSADRSKPLLTSRGAVLLRAFGPTQNAGAHDNENDHAPPLSPELSAALNEAPLNPLKALWNLLKTDGLLGPLALMGAMAITVGATLVEILLFRSIFDIADVLNLPGQRLAAVLGLLAFVSVLLLLHIPIVMESLRFGRHLEVRLRTALLSKLPHLTDRYFHSRPVSDMTDRSHSIYLSRQVPAMGLQCIQTVAELLFTLIGVALIDPSSTLLATVIVALAVCVPLALQALLNERDLRVRNHAGALHGFYLDALLGLVPIRTHRAEQAVRRQHEALLVEWARSSRGLFRMSLVSDSLQSLSCLGLAGYLLVQHFLRAQGVTGADLLLVYWVLKLPGLGTTLSALAHQYPAQRNILLRLLEPLSAPEERETKQEQDDAPIELNDVRAEENDHRPVAPASARGVAIAIEGGSVVAAGHTILEAIDLKIAPGEHVAIVGLSGAGKSTLLGLLLGWHRLGAGALLVDGLHVNAAMQESLRRQTAWIDPAIQIWNRPFMENLAYASPDDGLDRMGAVLDAAALRSVLEKLPRGLQTYLGEGGALLSGGEGQRVRLGRALLQTEVRLALLDEPFRGIDRSRRSALLADARLWWKDVTMLCVTHDVSETLSFDRVLVVEGGRIIEDDAPSRLAAAPSRYRALLEMESRVRNQMWNGQQWRHLQIRGGRIDDTGNARHEGEHASEH